MPEWVVLASVRRPRGIRGEVNAELKGSTPERFKPGLAVHLVREGSTTPAVVESAWDHNGVLVLKFRGIETRDRAEDLRGCDVCIPLGDRPPAPEGEYYFSDLVGCRVETPEGRELGEVRNWHEYGAAPLLNVWDGKRELLIPFTDAFYRTVDVPGRRIVIELPEGLEDVNGK